MNNRHCPFLNLKFWLCQEITFHIPAIIYGPPSARLKLSEEQKNKLQVFQGAVSSSGSYLNYLKETQCTLIGRLRKKKFIELTYKVPPEMLHEVPV